MLPTEQHQPQFRYSAAALYLNFLCIAIKGVTNNVSMVKLLRVSEIRCRCSQHVLRWTSATLQTHLKTSRQL